MINPHDSADKAIDQTIKELCRKLLKIHPSAKEFMPLAEAISKLRASLNPPICNHPEK